MKRVALVTGGNRGLGLETCRRLAQQGYQVILTSRDKQKGQAKVEELQQEGLDVYFAKLDVADPISIEDLQRQIIESRGRLDVLINNAAIFIDKDQKNTGEDESFRERRHILEETLNTNVLGAYELCERFIPLMQKQQYGRIVNISSGLGQLSEPRSEYIAYSISKTAINAVTTCLAARLKGTNILINSICPGWVKTDMGGPNAPRNIEQGVQGIIWAATLPDGGPSGGFFRDKEPINW